MQNRWPAWLVGYPVVDSVRKLHRRDNSLHRPGKEFRERSGVRDWFDSARSYFLPDSRLRQRAISRIRRWACDAANGAASCVGFHTEFATSSEIVARSSGSNAEARCRLLRLSAGEGETMKLRGCSLRFRNDPSPSPLPYEGRGDPSARPFHLPERQLTIDSESFRELTNTSRWTWH